MTYVAGGQGRIQGGVMGGRWPPLQPENDGKLQKNWAI